MKRITAIFTAFLFFVTAIIGGTVLNIKMQEKPIFVIGCVADPHIDYGIEKKPPYIRPSTIKAFEDLKAEKCDIMLVGGDITSANDTVWDDIKVFERAKKTFCDAAKSTIESGRVLYVDGNHENHAFGLKYDGGDYSDIMLRDTGKFEKALYQKDKPTHLLAYKYTFDDLVFIGLNTPWQVVDTGYEIAPETWPWLDDVLNGCKNKTVFVTMHYPLEDSVGLREKEAAIKTSKDAKAVLNGHKNVILLYGHAHAYDYGYINSSITERLTVYRKNGLPDTYENPENFISCFMGSFGYYYNSFNEGWLTEDDPKIVQALLIYVYKDKITFTMKNYGELTGTEKEPKSYTVKRNY